MARVTHPSTTTHFADTFISYFFIYLTDDDSNSLTLASEPPVPVKTTWTLLLYLTSANEGCVGGETVFYPHDRKSAAEEIAVPLETGMLLLHKHGDDCLLVSIQFLTFPKQVAWCQLHTNLPFLCLFSLPSFTLWGFSHY